MQTLTEATTTVHRRPGRRWLRRASLLMLLGSLAWVAFFFWGPRVPPPLGPGQIEQYFRVTSGDATLPVWVRGPSTATALVVFVHGGPGLGGIGTFDPRRTMSAMLEEELLIAYYDQRAAGGLSDGTSVATATLTLQQFNDDLDAVVGALQQRFPRQQLWLAGHSFGGQLATRYTAQHQDRVHGLVVIDSAPSELVNAVAMREYVLKRLNSLPETTSAISIAGRAWGRAELRAHLDTLSLEPLTQATHALLENAMTALYGEQLWDGTNLLLYFALQDYRFTPERYLPHRVLQNMTLSETAFEQNEDLWKIDLSREVAAIKRPTLVVWGAADAIFPLPNAYWLMQHLGTPASAKQLVVIEQATHFPQNEQPERVAHALKEFIRTNGQTAPRSGQRRPRPGIRPAQYRP